MANGFEPPIPYTGAKRLWAKELIAIAQKLSKGAKVLDAYGGSGLVSHVFKQNRPDMQVFCNDLDGYHSQWLPCADKVHAWWERWHDKSPTQDNADRATAALAAAIKDKPLADKIAAALIFVTARHGEESQLMRKHWPVQDAPWCQGVRFFKRAWGPKSPIPTSYALLILDPPYNTVKALDSTYYGTRRDDPPLSLWAAQEAFKSKCPAICWGRDGWLVDYPGGAVLAEKRASRGHNVEWLKGNPAFVSKYGKSLKI